MVEQYATATRKLREAELAHKAAVAAADERLQDARALWRKALELLNEAILGD